MCDKNEQNKKNTKKCINFFEVALTLKLDEFSVKVSVLETYKLSRYPRVKDEFLFILLRKI
jgi:hypothetical protein